MKKFLPWIPLLLLLSACAPSQSVILTSRNVYYSGPEEGVKTALSLAGFTLVSNPDYADVFVLNGATQDAEGIAARVDDGAGLVLILGKETTAADVQTLFGPEVTLTSADDPVSLVDAAGRSDPLGTEIAWKRAPQVRERFMVAGLDSSTTLLVKTSETGEGILWQESDRRYLLTAWLSGGANPRIQEWSYFNYLIYHLVERAAGGEPVSFAAYTRHLPFLTPGK